MVKKQKTSLLEKIKSHPVRTFSVGVLLLVLLWLLGVPQHSFYFVKCGGNLPVRFTDSLWSSFAGGIREGYMIPTDDQYYEPPYLFSSTFFCTEQGAIDYGLKPDPFSDLKRHLPSPSIYKED